MVALNRHNTSATGERKRALKTPPDYPEGTVTVEDAKFTVISGRILCEALKLEVDGPGPPGD